jgi:SAM-dependent methyltransferase
MEAASVHQQWQYWAESLRAWVVRAGRPIHKRLRKEKLDLFFKLSAGARRNTLLDVGGNSGIDSEWIPLYQAFREVTVANLDPSPDEHLLPHVRRIVADGCSLPFADSSFDWVFSNAVLEHVGGAEQQRKFAAEISRVATHGYFVTTPNKLFPIEPHTLLPLYQFLPEHWQRKLVHISPYYAHVYEEIRLLGPRDLGSLFPGATIVSTGFPIVGTSLVAMCGSANRR